MEMFGQESLAWRVLDVSEGGEQVGWGLGWGGGGCGRRVGGSIDDLFT